MEKSIVYKTRVWTETLNPVDSLDVLRELARKHAERGGRVGAELLKLIHEGDFAGLCLYKLDFTADWNVSELRACAQVIAFFKKLENLDIGLDLKKEAYEKFRATEARNLETNRTLRMVRSGAFSFTPRVSSAIYAAQRQIAAVLGPVPDISSLRYRFGKGGTTLTMKREASRREKLAAGVSCSENFFPWAKALLEEMPHFADANAVVSRTDEDGVEWCSVPVHLHDGRLNLVPKSATALRSAVTEPVLNGMFQAAVGDYLERRLSRFGIDLKDQTRNKDLARLASLHPEEGLATIDLSDASNLIAVETVFELLPLDWALFLSRGRTSTLDWQGERIPLQLFSSMGNGFTFPLETLLFWSLARAVSANPSRVSVYGDDIITDSASCADLKSVFDALGLVINEKKSYTRGPFRESCGGDYYKGIDVRPFFQKEWVSPRTLYALHNFYIKGGDDAMARYVLGLLSHEMQNFGPAAYGDGHLHTHSGLYLRKRRHIKCGYEGYVFRTLRLKSRRDDRKELPQDYAYALYTIYMRGATPLVEFVPYDVLKRRGLDGLNIFRHRPRHMSSRFFAVSDMGDSKAVGGFAVDAFPTTTSEYESLSIYTLTR
jgi:hypothetical protein